MIKLKNLLKEAKNKPKFKVGDIVKYKGAKISAKVLKVMPTNWENGYLIQFQDNKKKEEASESALVKESYVWERKFGEKLPTLASVQKKKNEGKLTEAKYKKGDTVTVTLRDNTKYKGKIENLSPFKLRIDKWSVKVFSNPSIKKVVKEGKLNETKSYGEKYKTDRGTLHIEIEEDAAGIFVDVIFNKVDLTTTNIEFPTGNVSIKQRKKQVKVS